MSFCDSCAFGRVALYSIGVGWGAASWGALGALWGPYGGHLGPFLGAHWGHLGPAWGHRGAVLGPSWGQVGPIWGLLGPLWGPLEAAEAHRKEKAGKPKNIEKHKEKQRILRSWPPRNGSWKLLGRSRGLRVEKVHGRLYGVVLASLP